MSRERWDKIFDKELIWVERVEIKYFKKKIDNLMWVFCKSGIVKWKKVGFYTKIDPKKKI